MTIQGAIDVSVRMSVRMSVHAGAIQGNRYRSGFRRGVVRVLTGARNDQRRVHFLIGNLDAIWMVCRHRRFEEVSIVTVFEVRLIVRPA